MLDASGLEALYVALEGPLYNVVYRWVWDPEAARDIVQEAFVRLWGMRERVAPETSRALAYRVALNLASKRRRRDKLWRWVTLDALLASERRAPAPGAEAALVEDERARAVRAAVEALPEKLRQVVMLCELGELPYVEVAAALDIPVGTVGSRRHAALKKLAAALEDRAP